MYKRIIVVFIIAVTALIIGFSLAVTYLPENIIVQVGSLAEFMIAVVGVMGLATVIISLQTLKQKRQREATDNVLLVYNSFRKEILGLNDVLYKRAKEVGVEIPNLGSLKKDTSFTLEEMTSLDKNKFRVYNKIVFGDDELKRTTINMFNAIEELSARIVLPGNSEHTAYKAIQKPFIELIEANAIMLYILRNFNDNPFTYTIALYKEWKQECPNAFMTTEDQEEHNSKKIDAIWGKK